MNKHTFKDIPRELLTKFLELSDNGNLRQTSTEVESALANTTLPSEMPTLRNRILVIPRHCPAKVAAKFIAELGDDDLREIKIYPPCATDATVLSLLPECISLDITLNCAITENIFLSYRHTDWVFTLNVFIDRVPIMSVHADSFARFTRVGILRIHGSDTEDGDKIIIKAGAFRGLTRLQVLTVYTEARQTRFEPGVFRGFPIETLASLFLCNRSYNMETLHMFGMIE